MDTPPQAVLDYLRQHNYRQQGQWMRFAREDSEWFCCFYEAKGMYRLVTCGAIEGPSRRFEIEIFGSKLKRKVDV